MKIVAVVSRRVWVSRVRKEFDDSECLFVFESHDFGNLLPGNTVIGPGSCLGNRACNGAKDGK